MNQPPTAPQPPSQLPPPHKDHYLSLPGANIMATTALAEVQTRITTAVRHTAMVCIHGNVGLGKTFAVHTVLRRIAPATTLRLRFRQAPNMSEIRGSLWRALNLPGEPPNHSADTCDQKIIEALEQEPRVLLLDEVQWLGQTALEYFRSLWGDEEQRAAVILVGSANTRQKILNRPALHSRIFDWYQFSPLTPNEVLATIPAYHPIWNKADPDLILYADDHCAHGSFRNWAKLTLHLKSALDDHPDHTLDKDLIRWAFSRLDPTARHVPRHG
ncbi:ATP-binding protein [Streptomyces sp. IB2014 016-6]|uniref:AAA family ATPase n=1 Tax=Streptomyces sp. IB2014 016-6 TaxID=2517818 RepID=UPI00164F7F24|nr:ATP-binding protein [Streptomyces sp. IB2014 016-6]